MSTAREHKSTASVLKLVASKFRKNPRVLTPTNSNPKAQITAGENTKGETNIELPEFPQTFTVVYITTEFQADDALKTVTSGDVGFDTEFTDRRPTKEEEYIMSILPPGQVRKAALTGWQIVELKSNTNFPVAWKNIGLRAVQLSQSDVAWVLDMWKIEAFPTELKRILESDEIIKLGAGLVKDISVIWDDLRFEMRNLVDIGLMARLLLAEKPPKTSFNNLALQISVEQILGFKFPKELARSDWAVDELTDEQITYAAQDAVACCKLYEVLRPALEAKSREIDSLIPSAWYTFDTRAGEPARRKKAADGSVVIWKQSDCTWYGGGKFVGYP